MFFCLSKETQYIVALTIGFAEIGHAVDGPRGRLLVDCLLVFVQTGILCCIYVYPTFLNNNCINHRSWNCLFSVYWKQS